MLNVVGDARCWSDTPLSEIALIRLTGDERIALLVAISSHD